MSDSASWLAYVGCRTTRERNASGRGIAVFRIDAQGKWAPLQLVEGLRNPSWLCVHPTLPRLYAAHGDFREISTFAIDAHGLLDRVAEQATHGANPVHLAFAPSRRWLLVANYTSGNVAAMRVAEDGTLGSVAHVLPLGEGSHPHQLCFSPDGRYALVPDKGLDVVFALAINEDTGHLRVAAASPMPRGSGPRHMAFHCGASLAYVVGELDRTLIAARYDGAAGVLVPASTHSCVPEGEHGGSAAGVVLSRSGRELYVSNRGHDSVAAFGLDDAGRPQAPRWIATARTPRFIALAVEGDGLIVAHEDGHFIASLDGSRASLQPLAQTGSPVCVVFRKANP